MVVRNCRNINALTIAELLAVSDLRGSQMRSLQQDIPTGTSEQS